jgi:hypothetical protein
LTLRQCRNLEKTHLEELHLGAHVLSGYQVELTIFQTKGTAQLEQGHFQRWVTVESESALSVPAVMVTGTVLGDVKVETLDAVQRARNQGKPGVVEMGSFPVQEGKTTTDPIRIWLKPGMELLDKKTEIQPNNPEQKTQILKVRLEKIPKDEAGPFKTGWRLWITIPPNAVVGSWPRDSAVILHVLQDKVERRIRIPVEAIASLE